MMVETILESSQDFGMSSGVVPQWKRELLQRRAARPRPPPPPPAPPPPPPPPPHDDDEELRYGPGIVKRLQSRYLSLALRDQPRRRASVLRRAASLEHLLDEPAAACRPARAPRPASLAVPHPPARRDFIKRARSVDALSRIDRRPPSPAPPCDNNTSTIVSDSASSTASVTASDTESVPAESTGPAACQPPPRAGRPPRRPQPLLREAEKPPPDLVRSALRKFEPGCPKRGTPSARVAAVLRGLETHRASQPRTSTPEPRGREPSPAVDISGIDEPECGSPGAAAVTRPVSRAALEGIAKAGSTVKFSFPAALPGSHLPPLAATNTVLVTRRVGVIRPLPPATPPPPPPPSKPDEFLEKISKTPRLVTPPPAVDGPASPPPPPPLESRLDRREPPAALVEPMPRSPLHEVQPNALYWESRVTPEAAPRGSTSPLPDSLTNGYREPSPAPRDDDRPPPALPAPHKLNGKLTKISGAKIEWNTTSSERKGGRVVCESESTDRSVCGWSGGGAARRRGPAPPASVSVVFNFSARAAVPDYIENDGIILRASRRDKIKAGDPGVVVLDPAAALRARCDSDDDEGDGGEDEDGGRGEGPPSPCPLRFVNDNVLINGKSSMQARPNPSRVNKLKLQFDDSLTRTFEYPSETSLCEDETAAPAPPPPPHPSLAANTHIASAALSGYTPSKTRPEEFRLGVTRHQQHDPAGAGAAGEAGGGGEEEEVRPCADAARSWSEARTHHTDLLF